MKKRTTRKKPTKGRKPISEHKAASLTVPLGPTIAEARKKAAQAKVDTTPVVQASDPNEFPHISDTGAGRPTEYDAKYCAMLVEHMGNGGTIGKFARKIGVNHQTILNWADANAEFLGAMQQGELALKDWLMDKGLDQFKEPTAVQPMQQDADRPWIQAKPPVKPFNTRIFVFMMKARFGMREGDENKKGDVLPPVPPTESVEKAVQELTAIIEMKKERHG